MLITKESSYILIRILLTIIVIPADVFSKPKYPWFLADALHQPVCTEAQCKRRSDEIWNSIDDTIDPCTNFYQYACSGWQRNHPILFSHTVRNIETVFDHRLFMRMRDQLQTPVSPKDSIDMKRSKEHYQTCSILPSVGKMRIEEVRERIKEAGPWPMMMTEKEKKSSSWNWADIHYYYFKMSADAGLFDVDISVDPQDFYKPLLDLKALHSPFGLIIRDGLWKPEWMKKYYHFLVKVAEKIIPERSVKITEKSLMHCMKEVFEFRRKLEAAVTDEVFDANAYHPLTLRELQYWSDANLITQSSKKVNWLKLLNSLFIKYSKWHMTVNTRVNVKHKKFFIALGNIISETPTQVIGNHLHMYFIERYLLLDSDLEAMASDVIIVKGVSIGSIRNLETRWERCIVKNNLKQTIDEMFISKVLKENVKKDIDGITDAMKDIIKMQISDSTWLDQESKDRGLQRIDDVKVEVSFPDPALDVMINGKKVDPNNVHAYYSVNENRVFISGTYLQSPMYTENLPYVVNYGSIGTLIAHELSHVFDKNGVSHTIYPKQTCKSLWSSNIVHIYEEKVKCIIEQYNRPIQGLLSIPRAPRNDGKRTLNENFADLMSLRVSYDAFKKRMVAEDRTCMILPNLKNIDCEKLFFISFAMTFCSNIPKWKLLRQTQYNHHSVPELRVNIPVANMPEFSKAFQCSKNSYVNSIKRCYVWD